MKRNRFKKPNKKVTNEKEGFFAGNTKSSENAGFFQPKLEISDPSDAFEVEAESEADRMINRQDPSGSQVAFGMQSVQRQAEKEEPAAKRIQRQAEEEEPAAKRIQRQAEEEEPAAKRIQRQAEEEEPAAKRIQRQAEEEEPAAKRIQRQAEEEEPAAKRIQRQAQEEEEPAAKRIQRQAQEEEPAAMRLDRKSSGTRSTTRLLRKSGRDKEKGGKQGTDPEMVSVEEQIQASKSGGFPLPEDIRLEMENHFGTDFSSVRIHSDAQAIALSAQLDAQAFTHGYHIYFNQGKYDPYSREGKHLLAHELTHVVQQKG